MIFIIMFWGTAFLLIWGWLLYPLSLFSITKLRRPPREIVADHRFTPSVSIIVTAHNEQEVIEQRIKNCLLQDYPPERFEVIVASDHSTDRTPEIVCSFENPRVRLVSASSRGKSAAQNEAVALAHGEIVVFSDADTFFPKDVLRQIVLPFSNSRVGCVAGSIVWRSSRDTIIHKAQDWYWRYEFWLWQLESALGIMAWSGGMCMAVRKSLFAPMEPYYGEDCIVPLDIVAKHHLVVFWPEAVCYEDYIHDPRGAREARIRMTVRSFRGTLSRWRLLNPVRYPGPAVSIASHKLIRWITGYLLVIVFLANLMVARSFFFQLTIWLQIAFYSAALVGHMLSKRNLRIPLISTAYSFCFMQLAMSVGVARAIFGKRIVAYQSVG